VPEGWSSISSGQEYSDFVQTDEQLAVCGLQSIQDLVEESRAAEGDDSSNDEAEVEPEPVPSFSQALKGYETVSRYLMSGELTEEGMRSVNRFGQILFKAHTKWARQPTITKFFKDT